LTSTWSIFVDGIPPMRFDSHHLYLPLQLSNNHRTLLVESNSQRWQLVHPNTGNWGASEIFLLTFFSLNRVPNSTSFFLGKGEIAKKIPRALFSDRQIDPLLVTFPPLLLTLFFLLLGF